jgi:MFS transporter, FSR family, fosmidomycin resistance protein
MSGQAKSRSILAIGCSVHAIQDGLTATIYVLLPILAEAFGLNYGQVGLFKAVKSIAQGMLEIVSGVAAERFGEKLLLIFGLVVAGTGYLLLSQAEGSNLVLLSLVLVGVGVAFQHALASAMIARAYDSAGRRGALGLYNSSGDVGKLAFSASFSLAIGVGIAWHSIALVFGAIAIGFGVVVLLLLDTLSSAQSETSTVASDSHVTVHVVGWGIIDPRSFSALFVVVFLDSMVQAGVLTFAAFLMLSKGTSLAVATMASVCILVGGIFGKAVCGFAAARFGVPIAFGLAQMLTAVGILFVVLSPAVMAYLLLPLLGIVLQGSTSMTYGMVADFVHKSRTARGFALIYASSSFASVAAPIGFGLIGDVYGIETALAAMAVVTLISLVPLFILREGPIRTEG